jgi:hypothetical protein
MAGAISKRFGEPDEVVELPLAGLPGPCRLNRLVER